MYQKVKRGKWLWLSWQSGPFQQQRSKVQIQSLANFYVEHLFTVNCIEKIITKKKRSVLAHLKIIRGPTNQTTKLLRIIGKWSVLLLNS